MGTDRNRVVVASGVCDCHTIHSTHAHHRDFPEIKAEGESPADAAARLINQLASVLDTASDRLAPRGRRGGYCRRQGVCRA